MFVFFFTLVFSLGAHVSWAAKGAATALAENLVKASKAPEPVQNVLHRVLRDVTKREEEDTQAQNTSAIRKFATQEAKRQKMKEDPSFEEENSAEDNNTQERSQPKTSSAAVKKLAEQEAKRQAQKSMESSHKDEKEELSQNSELLKEHITEKIREAFKAESANAPKTSEEIKGTVNANDIVKRLLASKDVKKIIETQHAKDAQENDAHTKSILNSLVTEAIEKFDVGKELHYFPDSSEITAFMTSQTTHTEDDINITIPQPYQGADILTQDFDMPAYYKKDYTEKDPEFLKKYEAQNKKYIQYIQGAKTYEDFKHYIEYVVDHYDMSLFEKVSDLDLSYAIHPVISAVNQKLKTFIGQHQKDIEADLALFVKKFLSKLDEKALNVYDDPAARQELLKKRDFVVPGIIFLILDNNLSKLSFLIKSILTYSIKTASFDLKETLQNIGYFRTYLRSPDEYIMYLKGVYLSFLAEAPAIGTDLETYYNKVKPGSAKKGEEILWNDALFRRGVDSVFNFSWRHNIAENMTRDTVKTIIESVGSYLVKLYRGIPQDAFKVSEISGTDTEKMTARKREEHAKKTLYFTKRVLLKMEESLHGSFKDEAESLFVEKNALLDDLRSILNDENLKMFSDGAHKGLLDQIKEKITS